MTHLFRIKAASLGLGTKKAMYRSDIFVTIISVAAHTGGQAAEQEKNYTKNWTTNSIEKRGYT